MTERTEKVQAYKEQDEKQLEKQFLTGIKDEDLGVYCDIFSAKSNIKGQDGGVVTALLLKGLREGLFDVAVVVRRLQGDIAEAFVAQSPEEVLASKGTSYVRVNVTKKLREIISQGKKRVAIVCTPCEAKALRKIQQTTGKGCNLTVVGLFCFEAFNFNKLREETKARLGVDLDRATKTQVRQGKFLATVDGKEYCCRVKELNAATERACHICTDFTSQFADVSVGSVGSKQGCSTVIVRSPVGERLLSGNDFAKEAVDKQEIIKLARLKSKRAEKSCAALNAAK
jgi:coenzyme F420-reducing hydrogenase beta subunit